MCSTIEIVARMKLIDPKSIRADTFGPMAGDRASISEGINIIQPEKERSGFNRYK
jgi:hypothetical protein